MSMVRVCLFAALAAAVRGAEVSPVQKVVELLGQCKTKVQNDLAAEAKAMEEYTTFCDTELEDKGYAIKTSTRTIDELTADVADGQAIIDTTASEIADTGAVLAGKDGEMAAAAVERKTANEGFLASEKEMLESIDELAGAVSMVKGAGPALLQGGKAGLKLRGAVSALSEIVKAGRLDFASHKRLHSLLQAAQAAKEDSDDLIVREAPKADAFESSTGGIMGTLEDMQKKAEDGLSELRKKEMESTHSFDMVKQNLENEMKNSQEKLALSTKSNAEAKEKLGQADMELVTTKKTKAADETYAASLKTECEMAAREWAERQASAKDEMGAIDKATDILVSGVKALLQVSLQTKSRRAHWEDDSSVETREDTIRVKLGSFLKKLARQQKSFALAQLASVSAADPFVKIRGLVEEMISKLVAEAQEEATQKAFCDEEMGKSKASKAEKEGLVEKHSSRLEEADSRMAVLMETIKILEGEIGAIDKSQTEATKVRAEEKADYDVASKDFRDSAEAVGRAIAVLQSYYEGAMLVQVRAHSAKAAAPKFGSANGDAGGSIISILEMAQEDFTTLLAEAEETEDVALEANAKLKQENEVARSTKDAEAKASASEMKSLKVTVENSKEDKASTSAELEAILAYIEKLKPQCESKVMSYAEKKAARAAEIEGLKNALTIIEGKGM